MVMMPTNNVILEQHYGNSGIEGIDNEILLAQIATRFDQLDRPYQRDDSLLVNGIGQNVGTGLTPDDNLVTGTVIYDANGLRLRDTDDNGNVTTYVYDGLDRKVRQTDANGNYTSIQYDNNNNILSATRVQINTDGLVIDKSITSSATYDELNRRTSETDALGNTQNFRYDSRNNLIQHTDPLGNITLHVYDGINRLLETRAFLGADGTGNSPLDDTNPTNPDGRISTLYAYDGNSRLVFQGDDNGNATLYEFDGLNRKIKDTFADGTTINYQYDKDDNLIEKTDQNTNVFTLSYDGLNRLTNKTVVRAANVTGSTRWTFGYDGLSRRISATDNNDPDIDSDNSQVEYRYNSLNYLLSETNNDLTATADYDGLGNRQTLTYPGGRILGYSYDGIYNLKTIRDQTTSTPDNIVNYSYADSRVLTRTYANGVTLSLIDTDNSLDAGYDAINRPLNYRHSNTNNQLVAGFSYVYDKAHNRRYEIDQFSQLADVYEYDSAYRLTRAAYDVPANDPTLQSLTNNQVINSDLASVIAGQDESYLLDGVGNWVSKQSLMGTESSAIGYQTNEMNEYLSIGPDQQQHDPNGNLLSDARRHYHYDAYNRLVRVTTLGGNTIATYKYDAFGRRISKRAGNDTLHYIHFGKRVIEERNAFSQLQRQYVYGNGIDEVLQLRNAANQDYYYHANSLGSIAAITDSNGAVVERYQYNAYGETSIFAANGLDPLTTSQIGNSYGFTGRRLDSETGFYYYRARYYAPQRGRFIQRDPLGYQDGMGVYAYVGNNPVNFIDPMGTEKNNEFWDAVKDELVDLIPGKGLYDAYQAFKEGNIIEALINIATELPWGKAFKLVEKLGRIGELYKRYRRACCCFVAGTSVLTAAGPIPIEQLNIGDWVYSKNLVTRQVELKQVETTYLTEGKEIYALTTEDSDGGLETVQVTDNHPYWVEGQNWVESADLKPGMKLIDKNDESVTVISIQAQGYSEPTFNISVGENYNYFVGEQELLVHNCSCGRYVPPAKNIPGIPGLRNVKPKTPFGGGKRKRWKDKDGNIYEWDYQHGKLEKYDRRGRHKGEFDPETGEQTKPPDSNRRVEP